MARVKNEDQLGLDEEVIENPDVEAALVARQDLGNARRQLNKDFRKAHEKVVALLSLIELPEEGAVRIGRFRISSRIVLGTRREFDTSDRIQISIAFLGEQTSARLTDDADLRPKGEVNPEALRAEAERASEPTPIRPPKTGSQPSAPH